MILRTRRAARKYALPLGPATLASTPDGTRLITAGAAQGAKPWNNDRAWWQRHALVNGGREAQIRGEVFIWQAPRDPNLGPESDP